MEDETLLKLSFVKRLCAEDLALLVVFVAAAGLLLYSLVHTHIPQDVNALNISIKILTQLSTRV